MDSYILMNYKIPYGNVVVGTVCVVVVVVESTCKTLKEHLLDYLKVLGNGSFYVCVTFKPYVKILKVF